MKLITCLLFLFYQQLPVNTSLEKYFYTTWVGGVNSQTLYLTTDSISAATWQVRALKINGQQTLVYDECCNFYLFRDSICYARKIYNSAAAGIGCNVFFDPAATFRAAPNGKLYCIIVTNGLVTRRKEKLIEIDAAHQKFRTLATGTHIKDVNFNGTIVSYIKDGIATSGKLRS